MGEMLQSGVVVRITSSAGRRSNTILSHSLRALVGDNIRSELRDDTDGKRRARKYIRGVGTLTQETSTVCMPPQSKLFRKKMSPRSRWR